MRYLDELAESLLALDRNEPPAVRQELLRLLEAYDERLHLRLQEQRGDLIRRDRLAETIAASMREAIVALVAWACDEQRVPPGLRKELEAVFSEVMAGAIKRCMEAVNHG